MNDLRKDINEVFARQQDQLGDVSEAGNRMLRAATSARRVKRQLWPSVAGVALVLIAGSAVGLSVVIRGQHPKNVVTSHPSRTPIATPVPTPMSQPLQVPSTTPVILFRDPGDWRQIDGIIWDGSAKGRVAVNPGDNPLGFVQNPAGTLFGWTGYDPAGTLHGWTWDIRDRADAVVAAPTADWRFSATWADDGQHYCSMVSKSALPPAGGEPATLQLTAVGQAPRNVVQVGRRYDQYGALVAACSIEKDRAVVVESSSTGRQFWVVQLSTGRVLWRRPGTGEIRSSHDGQYIAEINYSQLSGASATTIYNASGGVLGHLAGRVDAFSWDGSLAVWSADDNGPVSIVRWRDGTVLWTGPTSGRYLGGALPEPGGQRIAVSVIAEHPPTSNLFEPRNVYVIGPDGKAIRLLTDVG